MKKILFLTLVSIAVLSSFALKPSGSIHIEGDILVVDTGSPAVEISGIQIYSDYSTIELEYDGCDLQNCEYDISTLYILPVDTFYLKVNSGSQNRWFTFEL